MTEPADPPAGCGRYVVFAVVGVALLVCLGCLGLFGWGILTLPPGPGPDAETTVLTVDEVRERLAIELPGNVDRQTLRASDVTARASRLHHQERVIGATVQTEILTFRDPVAAENAFGQRPVPHGFAPRPGIADLDTTHAWWVRTGPPVGVRFAVRSGPRIVSWQLEGVAVDDPDQLLELVAPELEVLLGEPELDGGATPDL